MPIIRSLYEIDERIAIVRGNMRDLTEQAAAYSGAADEERAAERISDLQDQLDVLLKEREARLAEDEAAG
jgi:hypothetical protein